MACLICKDKQDEFFCPDCCERAAKSIRDLAHDEKIDLTGPKASEMAVVEANSRLGRCYGIHALSSSPVRLVLLAVLASNEIDSMRNAMEFLRLENARLQRLEAPTFADLSTLVQCTLRQEIQPGTKHCPACTQVLDSMWILRPDITNCPTCGSANLQDAREHWVKTMERAAEAVAAQVPGVKT